MTTARAIAAATTTPTDCTTVMNTCLSTTPAKNVADATTIAAAAAPRPP